MKPIGPLMVEHRLIERMIALLRREITQISSTGKVNVGFLMASADFMRTYADKTHHGKEEYILFRDLAKKNLSPEHKKIMEELIQEHTTARNTVTQLVVAREKYINEKGSASARNTIISCLAKLVGFYPPHIEKEDKHFFFPCLEYFDKKEQDAMLQEFWEYDRKMIHEKYERAVKEFEQGMRESLV
jgi:hemerythrin-like domain-containing protein